MNDFFFHVVIWKTCTDESIHAEFLSPSASAFKFKGAVDFLSSLFIREGILPENDRTVFKFENDLVCTGVGIGFPARRDNVSLATRGSIGTSKNSTPHQPRV